MNPFSADLHCHFVVFDGALLSRLALRQLEIALNEMMARAAVMRFRIFRRRRDRLQWAVHLAQGLQKAAGKGN